MTLAPELMSGGLPIDYDYVFPERPADPEMRESASIWLFEENGAFGFPRVGVEAEAHSWDENRLYHANFALAGGRALHDTGRAQAPSAVAEDGRPRILGAGPLSFRCVEPFRKWRVSFEGTAADSHVRDLVRGGKYQGCPRAPVKFDVEIEMVTPAWVHDNPPEKLAKLSPQEAEEAGYMGIGWRCEHMFRGEGEFTLDGQTRAFKALGTRVHRQSVRPLGGFRGHTWQSAVFPDGRGFGYIAYPPNEDGSPSFNDGYVFENGRMYKAKAVKVPWLRRLIGEGDDVALELEYEGGVARIEGATALTTFRVGNPEIGGLNLQQGGARYVWDGQTAFGMIERSAHESQTSLG